MFDAGGGEGGGAHGGVSSLLNGAGAGDRDGEDGVGVLGVPALTPTRHEVDGFSRRCWSGKTFLQCGSSATGKAFMHRLGNYGFYPTDFASIFGRQTEVTMAGALCRG